MNKHFHLRLQACKAWHKYLSRLAHILISEMVVMCDLPGRLKSYLKTNDLRWTNLFLKWRRLLSNYVASLCYGEKQGRHHIRVNFFLMTIWEDCRTTPSGTLLWKFLRALQPSWNGKCYHLLLYFVKTVWSVLDLERKIWVKFNASVPPGWDAR